MRSPRTQDNSRRRSELWRLQGCQADECRNPTAAPPRPAPVWVMCCKVGHGTIGHRRAPSCTVGHGRARRSASGHGGWVRPRGALGSRAERFWVGLVWQRSLVGNRRRCQTRPTQHHSARLPSAPRGPTQPPCSEALRRARPCTTVPDGAPPCPAPPCNTSPNRVRGVVGRGGLVFARALGEVFWSP
jgi:hypothetical protein